MPGENLVGGLCALGHTGHAPIWARTIWSLASALAMRSSRRRFSGKCAVPDTETKNQNHPEKKLNILSSSVDLHAKLQTYGHFVKLAIISYRQGYRVLEFLYMEELFPIYDVKEDEFPPLLREIPQPPKTLNYRGVLPSPHMKLLSVVGSRKYSTYGKQVVDHLITGLRGYNVGIVSGLALGIDSLAHESALAHGLYTIAVPGSGLDDRVIYPASHKPLARKILQNGGGMLSEFDRTFTATKWSFTQRNRIMAGIAHTVLVIEASEKSGTLITARMAVDYNRELLVVPGNIFSQNSAGPHQFLKLGATPVTTAEDILYALGFSQDEVQRTPTIFTELSSLSPEEQSVLAVLCEPRDKDSLLRKIELPTNVANALLMQMEIKGLLKESNGVFYRA